MSTLLELMHRFKMALLKELIEQLPQVFVPYSLVLVFPLPIGLMHFITCYELEMPFHTVVNLTLH